MQTLILKLSVVASLTTPSRFSGLHTHSALQSCNWCLSSPIVKLKQSG